MKNYFRPVAHAIDKWVNKPVMRSTHNLVAKMWLISGGLSAINVGYKLGGILAVGYATPTQLIILVLIAIYATIAFSIVWFALHQGSRVMVKNCTFTGNHTGLHIPIGRP